MSRIFEIFSDYFFIYSIYFTIRSYYSNIIKHLIAIIINAIHSQFLINKKSSLLIKRSAKSLFSFKDKVKYNMLLKNYFYLFSSQYFLANIKAPFVGSAYGALSLIFLSKYFSIESVKIEPRLNTPPE